ncbi:hypothetical protein MKX03_030478 [Papaver bracteatum]|nr:hypothetical protein MKX03_030478 [Papaver bracteatum]
MVNKDLDGGKRYARRDKLLEIERNVQTWWDESDVFREESCEKPPKLGENFPYSYMNGLLHFGQAFSLSKLEFAAAYQRLRGANIARFGNPPVIPSKEDHIINKVPEPGGKTEPDKFKSKKSKAKSKSGGEKYQWEIMKESISLDWIIYFPPVAKEDLQAFGLGCDWCRSFITTDMNPYYDSFVRWQIGKLKEMGKIVKGLRYARRGEPCAGHDRASGEDVDPPFLAKMGASEGKRTNAWVLAEGKYGAYEINETDVFVVTEHIKIFLGFSVKHEWIFPFEVVLIINIPEFEDRSAERVCWDLKVKSQNEKEKLAEAKRWTYLKGFTQGTMLSGEFAGMRVQDAKPLIKNKLLKNSQAVSYSEPEKTFVFRSGYECAECLSNMKLYHGETHNVFDHTLSWLNKWGWSRSFGLGTRIPFDAQFLVESLSDSTLYMAYYTIDQMLQNEEMYGKNTSLLKPEQVTDGVWNCVFGEGVYPKSSSISQSVLNKMKHEVTGKELIQNHLTFTIYHHTALLSQHHRPCEAECLNILRDTEARQFAPHSEIQSELKQNNIGQQANFKQVN